MLKIALSSPSLFRRYLSTGSMHAQAPPSIRVTKVPCCAPWIALDVDKDADLSIPSRGRFLASCDAAVPVKTKPGLEARAVCFIESDSTPSWQRAVRTPANTNVRILVGLLRTTTPMISQGSCGLREEICSMFYGVGHYCEFSRLFVRTLGTKHVLQNSCSRWNDNTLPHAMFSAVRGSFFIRHLGEGFRYLRNSNQIKRRRKSSSVASSILALVCFVARRLDSVYVHSSFTWCTSGAPAFARSSISFPPHHSIEINSGLHERGVSLFGQHPFARSHCRHDSQDNRRSFELSAGRHCRHTTTTKPRQRSSWKIDSSIYLGIDDTTYQPQARSVQSGTKDVGFEHLAIHGRTTSKTHPAQGTSDKRRGVTDKAFSNNCQGLDSQWPDAPGEDVPFEFHHMEEVSPLSRRSVSGYS